MARANRFGFLVGGINAAIYGLVYLSEGLYFSSVSALLISFPIQLYSFLNWTRKRTAQNRTELKKFDLTKWIVCLSLALAGWAACYFGLAKFFKGALLPAFDTFLFSMGIIVSVLAARRYVDSQYLNILSTTVSVVMWTIICASNPSNANYLIIACYNLFMMIKSSIHWTKQYNADKAGQEENIVE